MHSAKLQHHWNLTIRLFSVISGHSWGGGGCRGAVGVFWQLGNTSIQRTNKSPFSKKGGNHLLFSGLEYKGGTPHVIAAEEQTTKSARLRSYSWKRRISPVHLVMWPKRTRDMGKLLKHWQGRWLHLVSMVQSEMQTVVSRIWTQWPEFKTLDRTVCISLQVNALGNPSILLPAVGKGSLALVKQPV